MLSTFEHLKQVDFLLMSEEEKRAYVLQLQNRREKLKQENLHQKRRKATKNNKKPFKFATPELEAMFNLLPEDCRAAVLGQKK
jgi:hypothetical protein